MGDIVSYEFEDSVAIIRMDDGKVNAVSYALLDELNAAFDRAEQDQAKAIGLIGREGKFSAGFDLAEMGKGREQAANLLSAGGDLLHRLYTLPVSLVLGVTGHSMAMGALMLFTGDERIGADGPFKIGLNEVKIGMAMPGLGIVLAEDRIERRFLTRAVANAELFTPAEAIEVGYLDRIVEADQVETVAIAMAKTMAESLNQAALAETKLRLRAKTAGALSRVLSEGRGL